MVMLRSALAHAHLVGQSLEPFGDTAHCYKVFGSLLLYFQNSWRPIDLRGYGHIVRHKAAARSDELRSRKTAVGEGGAI